jgi:hypothetical protein
MADLNGRLMGDKNTLWSTGILRLVLEDSPPAEFASSVNAWRVTATYRVLYEYRYEDSDGAESLIARIPIDSDLEVPDSPEREATIVTDEMARWDNEAAPPLIIRGAFSIGSLSALAFVPGTAPTGTVTVKRTHDEALGSPANYSTWAAFLTAVAGSNAPQRHAQTSFASLAEFLDAFSVAGDPVTLGDWNLDSTADGYDTGLLAIQPPIHLPGVTDIFEVTYQSSMFDQLGVVYLRAGRG